MQLKALEIQGFKSFPDKTRLTFGEGITAVVGPNGSGKSNISDAVRWVLGENSKKNLRGTKMEDVIFNGTKNRKPLGFAEVTLILDNSARDLSFDNDEVAVTRRYYRSGESEYLINGATVRLRDILELFMDTGLGQDGYSIIGQGRISEIVSARSDERREIFEEAAGISKYRSKKEESERHLKVAEDNMERLLDILNELESQVEPLRQQSEKAKKFLDYDGERKGLEIGLALIRLDKSRDQLREIEYKLSVAQNQYEEATKSIEASDSRIDELTGEGQRLAAQAEEIRATARSLEEQAAAVESEIAVIRNDILRDTEVQERIESDIAEMLDSGHSFDALIAEKQAQIEESNRAVAAKEEEIASLEAKLGESIAQADRLTGELEETSKKLADLTVAVSERNVRSANKRTTAEELNGSVKEIKERVSVLSDRADVTRRELALLQKELAENEDKLQSLKNSESGYAMKLENRRKKLEEKEEEVRRIGLSVSEKEQRAEMLRAMERRFEGFGNSVRTVMQEASAGHLRGILGPVSSILSVENKYSVAIETALGGALQNIVVKNEDDAKNAISFLKQRDAGRATFLPLTSVKGTALDEPGLSSMNGFVGYAYKLVSYASEYDGIAKSLLGRIVVVTDMNAGTAIARAHHYKFRLVTLDGQVINAGGSYTGGSVVKSAGILTRSHDIEELTAQAEKLRASLDKASAEKKSLTEETASIEAAYVGLKAEMQTANENIIRLNGDVRLKEDQLASAESMLSSLAEQSDENVTRAAALLREAETEEKETEEMNAEIAVLETKISEATGGRSEVARLREEQSNAISEGRMAVYQLKKDVDAALAAIDDLNARHSESDDKVAAFRAEIASLADKKTAAESHIAELNEQAKKLRDDVSASALTVDELMKKRDAIETEINTGRSGQHDKYDERERINADFNRLQERRDNLNAEHDRILETLLTEHELTRTEAEQVAPHIDDPAAASKRLTELKNKIRALGNVNINAIEDYKEVHARYSTLKMQYDDVTKSRDQLLRIISDVTGKMKSIFNEEFVKINLNFTETFRELFGGGNASLVLSDPDDVLSSGIEIHVAPPGKIINNLASLSGGEQALVAMAIYFAILKVRPSPFCIVDEVETALDDVNVTRFASYMRRMSDNTQFIAITHRRGTMEEADVLYGVTMQEEGVTKLLVMNVSELEHNEAMRNIVK